MPARKLKIDLLLRKDLTQKYSGRFLLWALTVGRYIAIFTELVVIAGVIARFTLDYQRNNITEDVLEQQKILASYQLTETRMKRLSKLFSTVAAIEGNKSFAAELLTDLGKVTPFDLRFETLQISPESMEMSGVSLSANSFAAFLSGLNSFKEFDDIILDSIQSGGPQDSSIHFTLSVTFTKTSLKQIFTNKEKI